MKNYAIFDLQTDNALLEENLRLLIFNLFLLMSNNQQFVLIPNPENQKYKLSKLDFSTNEHELSSLKKKMLAHAYDLQIHSKQRIRRETTASSGTIYDGKSSNSSSNIRYIPSYMDINMAHIEKQKRVKSQLAADYQKQMEIKNQKNRQEKQRKLAEEQKMIEVLKNMDRIQQERNKQTDISYRRQADEQLALAKIHKMHELEEINREKQQYNKKIATSILRNSSQQENQKLNKFKQHYDNVNRIQYRIEKNYLDQWSPLIKQQQLEKQRLIQAGIHRVHNFQRNLYPKLEQSQNRHRTELKQALQKQIRQKQMIKSLEKQRYKSQSYITNSQNYRSVHHPIVNPIDFKMAHDNRKILTELKEEEEYETRLSGLARNGSLVLLPNRNY